MLIDISEAVNIQDQLMDKRGEKKDENTLRAVIYHYLIVPGNIVFWWPNYNGVFN